MNNIKIYREKENLTQEELAKKAKVDRSNLSLWENDKGSPNLRTLKKLATALGVTVAELIS